MSCPVIRIERIEFDEPDGGRVWYEIAHEDGSFSYMTQPFNREGRPTRRDRLVWAWDGNRDAPTLTPSFLCRDTRVVVHLFLRNGAIDLCGDSTVRVR